MASEQETISDESRPTISIEFNRASYNNGDIVEGFVVIHNTKEISIKSISVRCMGQGSFNSNNSQEERMLTSKAPFSNSETYFDMVQNVLDISDVNDGVTTLPSGNHRYNFHFQMPDEIPSSFVTPIGSIEYSCNVIVHLPGSHPSNNNYQYERSFVVVSRLDINVVENPTKPLGLIEKKKFHSFIFLPSGSIKVTVLLNQKAFILGDHIKMNILIENKYRKLHVFEVCLRRVIVYYASKGQSIGHILPPLEGVAFESYTLPAGRTSANDVEINLPQDMPPTHLGRGCNIMKVGYFLEIALWAEKVPKKPPIFHYLIPILIGTQNQAEQATTTTTTTPKTMPSTTDLDTPPPSYDMLTFPDSK